MKRGLYKNIFMWAAVYIIFLMFSQFSALAATIYVSDDFSGYTTGSTFAPVTNKWRKVQPRTSGTITVENAAQSGEPVNNALVIAAGENENPYITGGKYDFAPNTKVVMEFRLKTDLEAGFYLTKVHDSDHVLALKFRGTGSSQQVGVHFFDNATGAQKVAGFKTDWYNVVMVLDTSDIADVKADLYLDGIKVKSGAHIGALNNISMLEGVKFDANNLSKVYIDDFKIYVPDPLSCTSTIPFNGAGGLGTNPVLQFNFNNPVNPETLQISKIQVKDGANSPVNVKWAALSRDSAKKVIAVLDEPLALSKTYTVSVTDIRDVMDSSAGFSFSFSTASTVSGTVYAEDNFSGYTTGNSFATVAGKWRKVAPKNGTIKVDNIAQSGEPANNALVFTGLAGENQYVDGGLYNLAAGRKAVIDFRLKTNLESGFYLTKVYDSQYQIAVKFRNVGSGNQIGVHFFDTGTSGSQKIDAFRNDWYHVVMVLDSTVPGDVRADLYLNGVKVKEGVSIPGLANTDIVGIRFDNNGAGTTYVDDFKAATLSSAAITSSSPANGAVDVGVNSLIEVEFNNPIDPKVLSLPGVSVVDDRGNPVAVKDVVPVFNNMKKIRVTLGEILALNTHYTVTVPGIGDVQGSAAAQSVSFTTTANPFEITEPAYSKKADGGFEPISQLAAGEIHVNVTVTNNKQTGYENAVLIMALRRNGMLEAVNFIEKSIEAGKSEPMETYVNVAGDLSGCELKTMLWDDFEGLKPYMSVDMLPQ